MLPLRIRHDHPRDPFRLARRVQLLQGPRRPRPPVPAGRARRGAARPAPCAHPARRPRPGLRLRRRHERGHRQHLHAVPGQATGPEAARRPPGQYVEHRGGGGQHAEGRRRPRRAGPACGVQLAGVPRASAGVPGGLGAGGGGSDGRGHPRRPARRGRPGGHPLRAQRPLVPDRGHRAHRVDVHGRPVHQQRVQAVHGRAAPALPEPDHFTVSVLHDGQAGQGHPVPQLFRLQQDGRPRGPPGETGVDLLRRAPFRIDLHAVHHRPGPAGEVRHRQAEDQLLGPRAVGTDEPPGRPPAPPGTPRRAGRHGRARAGPSSASRNPSPCRTAWSSTCWSGWA